MGTRIESNEEPVEYLFSYLIFKSFVTKLTKYNVSEMVS